MVKPIKVCSAQFNYQYGTAIHFPYSIACLVAYIKSFPDLAGRFQFETTFVFRNKFDEYLSRCTDADILLCSCYSWNWEITTRLARAVKARNPRCLVIFGGPQVPFRYEGAQCRDRHGETGPSFFADYPDVDVLVHREGEHTLKDLFAAVIGDADYSQIPGVETRDFRTSPAARIADLDALPSPYLTNLVWDLVESVAGVSYIASWETNRGCPFECTFCDWGSATFSRVRKRSMDVLLREIEWFADNRIPYVDVCDANFGIFAERDLALARALKSEKLKKGFPGRVRPAWVKGSSARVIPIARELLEADLLRAVTLAVQSLDRETLGIIKRTNLRFDRFAELVQDFSEQRIETYTEVILGLPGETLESYRRGLEQLMELFPRPMIFIYNCGVFVNAPMNEPEYLQAHGIEVVRSPIYLWHSSVDNRGTVPEYEYITIRSNTFSTADLRQMYLLGWAVQAFHSLGILEYVAKFYHQIHRWRYVDFYGSFLDYCAHHPDTLFGREYGTAVGYIANGYAGGGWDHADPGLAPIYWPLEEATWLRCVRDSTRLEAEVLQFLRNLEPGLPRATDSAILADLVRFQVFLLSTMDHREPVKVCATQYEWKGFLRDGCSSLDDLVNEPSEYAWHNKVTTADPIEWCYKAVWVGRTQGNYKCHLETLLERRPSIACAG
jgi:radical SAM superfamily enzyme YgiQ (UPF0313 family)